MKQVEALSHPIAVKTRSGGLTLDGVWATVVVALAIGVTFSFRMNSVDLAYHLRAGEAILTTHTMPWSDPFTFTMAGRAWLDQQWGAQILLTLVFRTGGWPALASFHGVLVGAAFLFLWLGCRARGATARMSAALSLSGFLVCLPNTGMRPQTMAYPLFTATLWILAGRGAHPRRLWVLPLLMAAWANVHGSFPLGLMVIAFAYLEDRRDHAATKKTTLLVGGLSLLATVAGPYGIDVWRYAVDVATNHRILGQVQEWAPTTIRSPDGVLFFASALAVVAFLARRAKQIDVISLLWLGSFFILGLGTARGQVWWGFVFPVTLAGLIAEAPSASTERDRGNRALNLVVVTSLVAFVAVASPWLRERVDPATGSSSLLSYAPQHLVDAVQRETPAGARLLVTLAYASWFEYALPADPLFVDPRIESFSDSVWDDYSGVMDMHEGWRGVLDRWHIDAIVLLPGDDDLANALESDTRWHLTFEDGTGSVFVRD